MGHFVSSAIALRALDQHQKHGVPLPDVGGDSLERHLVWEAVAMRADMLDGLRALAVHEAEAKQVPLEAARAEAARLLQERQGR